LEENGDLERRDVEKERGWSGLEGALKRIDRIKKSLGI
jgi:hypothetical protein